MSCNVSNELSLAPTMLLTSTTWSHPASMLTVYVVLLCVIVVSSLVLTLQCVIRRLRDPLRSLPGPLSLPGIGSVLSLGSKPHLALTAFREKYGDVLRINIGTVPVVVLNGPSVVREALLEQADAFSGRPALLTFQLASEGASMAFNSVSPQWRVHRRIAERGIKLALRDTPFTANMTEEAEMLADQLLSESKPQDPTSKVTWSVAHAMYSFCFGDSRTSTDFQCMINDTLRLIHCHKMGNMLNFFPWLRPLMRSAYTRLQKICAGMMSTTKRQEQLHLDSYKPGVTRDALDALIRVSMDRPESMSQSRVLHTVQEYLGAGMDIVYLSLLWGLFYLNRHPAERRALAAEGDHSPSPDLRSRPRLHAFILETLRYSAVVPLALPHYTTQDTTLRGHCIPADTVVLVNLHSVHMDRGLWGDPDTFRPARFLDATGRLNENAAREMCAFSLGRRRCVGEAASLQALAVYLSVLLRRCEFLDPVASQPYAERDSGILLRPGPFLLQLAPRT